MKSHSRIGFICLMLIFALASCLKEEDDVVDASVNMGFSNNIGETAQGDYQAAMATVIDIDVLGQVTLRHDDGTKVYPVNTSVLSEKDALHKGQRLFYTYQTTAQTNGKTYIQLIEVEKVSTLPFSLPSSDTATESYGTDAVSLTGQHTAGGYLNLQYQYMEAENSTVVHLFHLILKTETPDNEGYLTATLRHDAQGDLPQQKRTAYASFPLDSLTAYKEHTLKGFILRFHSLEGKDESVRLAIQ